MPPNIRVEAEVDVSDDLWKEAEEAGRIKIDSDGRWEVRQALSYCIRHSAEMRTWPPEAERLPLERLKKAAEEFQAALAGLDAASVEIVDLVASQTTPTATPKQGRKRKLLKPEDINNAANRAVQQVKGNFYYRHCEVIWKRAPQVEGGYTDDEFEFRLTKISHWWVTLAKDVCQVRDSAVESLCLAPHGREHEYPLMGCLNRFRGVYAGAGGKVAANRQKDTKVWSPFVRWSHRLMLVLPPEVRPSSIPALGSFIRRNKLIPTPTSSRK